MRPRGSARWLAGLLLLGGCAQAPAGPLETAVLYSRATPEMQPQLPPGPHARYAVEGFRPPGRRARAVIVSGHAAPPEYLGQAPRLLARAIASFEPELVVVDTCFGASLPLLEALAASGVTARVVAPPFRIPTSGLHYAPAFFAPGPAAARARLVRTEPDYPLLRWRIAAEPLTAVRREVAGLGPEALSRRLKHAGLALVKAELPEGAGPVLVDVAPARFGRAR